MKIPLRYQITEFDCGTVSLQNAFNYLFEREEIPAELVKAIHKYTLDCYDEDGNLGQGGTSREAINKLTHWITRYTNSHDFSVSCVRYDGEDVNIDLIKECVNSGGCVLVRSYLSGEHYIIVTKIDDDKVYIFDPYYLDRDYYDDDMDVRIVNNKPFTHNRVVNMDRFLSKSKKDFSLGSIENREIVLINRV